MIKMWFEQIYSDPFGKGFLFGAATVTAVLLFLWLLNLLFGIFSRKKHCSTLTMTGEGGKVVIAESAVVATVKIFSNEFPALEVRKVKLFKVGGNYLLVLVCNFLMDSDLLLTDVAAKFRTRTLDGLKSVLGIDGKMMIDLRFQAVKPKDANNTKSLASAAAAQEAERLSTEIQDVL